MAELVIDNDCLHVELSALERVDAVHGDFTVPIIPIRYRASSC